MADTVHFGKPQTASVKFNSDDEMTFTGNATPGGPGGMSQSATLKHLKEGS